MRILGAFIVTLGSSFALASPQYLELQKNSTTAAGVSVLTAHLRIQPSHPGMEIYIDSVLDEEPLHMTRVSDSKSLAITLPLGNGTYEWTVKAYLQDRQVARQYDSLIAFYDQENERLYWEIIEESNPLIRSQKEDERDQNLALRTHAKELLSEHRRLLETQTLSFEVTDGASLSVFSENPILQIEGAGEVEVGERIILFVRSLTPFEGADGPQEIVIRGEWAAEPGSLNIETSAKRVGAGAFSFVSDPLVSEQAGEHVFTARLHVRSLAQSEQLRQAMSDLGQRRNELIRQLAFAADEYERALYQTQLDDAEKMMAALKDQLEGLLLQIGGPKTFAVSVLEAETFGLVEVSQ